MLHPAPARTIPASRDAILTILACELGRLDIVFLNESEVDALNLMDDLGMHVLDAVEVHRILEESFGVTILDEEFSGAPHVGELVALVLGKAAA